MNSSQVLATSIYFNAFQKFQFAVRLGRGRARCSCCSWSARSPISGGRCRHDGGRGTGRRGAISRRAGEARSRRAVVYVLLALATAITLFPVAWMATVSIRPERRGDEDPAPVDPVGGDVAGVRARSWEPALPAHLREQRTRSRSPSPSLSLLIGRARRLRALPLPLPRPAARDGLPDRHPDVPARAPLHPLLPRHGAARALRHADVARARLHHLHAAVLHPHAPQRTSPRSPGARGGRDGGRLLAARRDRPHPPAALRPRSGRLRGCTRSSWRGTSSVRGGPDRVLGKRASSPWPSTACSPSSSPSGT